ncbi:hypothetical protein QVZ41_13885 [Wenyingzhuangia sp. chi5]|uniref:GLPGLI family protein n=1 Tax=Wenyingzhuangia gilva TaxID=3057677 RepID=A0ABT8VVE0_9FLAO|nr:hypothetical protein [Wenyingzhuangia sp. chi5]MDO3695937.1 hypothetical protein [Wenyingzhuangia sp. chi5]
MKYLIQIIISCLILIFGFFVIDMNSFAKGVKLDAENNTFEILQKDSVLIVEIKSIENQLEGVYEYEYENNTEALVENHYIQFEKNRIIYFGTTDDFDQAREGYFPGFFMKEIYDFKIAGNQFSFSLKVNNNEFFEKAITPYLKPNQNPKWTIGVSSFERFYKGQIIENKLIIETNGFEKRVFVKK